MIFLFGPFTGVEIGMPIETFQNYIRKHVHRELYIRQSTNDLAGVYYNNYYLNISLPPKFIYHTPKSQYTDKHGVQYRCVLKAVEAIRNKLKGMNINWVK